MQIAIATRYEGYGAKPSGDATSLRPENNANAPFDHEQDLFRPSAKVTTEQIDDVDDQVPGSCDQHQVIRCLMTRATKLNIDDSHSGETSRLGYISGLSEYGSTKTSSAISQGGETSCHGCASSTRSKGIPSAYTKNGCAPTGSANEHNGSASDGSATRTHGNDDGEGGPPSWVVEGNRSHTTGRKRSRGGPP